MLRSGGTNSMKSAVKGNSMKKHSPNRNAIRKRRRRVCMRVLWLCGMVVSIFAGFWIARAQVVFDSINQDTENRLEDVKLPEGSYNTDNDIINILVIGNDYREESGYAASGLPDCMMIATLDNKHKNLKLTSLMRDQVVQIPGYGENKLNACFGYEENGPTLLYKTIAQNYNIKVDGYVEVGFDAVKAIVNAVGGINVELSESEAAYLNATNYIKPAKYRMVKAGMNKLNGAQALGYSRIRKTAKGMSLSSLMDMAQEILSKYVTTDLGSEDILRYMKDVVMMGSTEIQQLQIPVEGYYTNDPSYYSL